MDGFLHLSACIWSKWEFCHVKYIILPQLSEVLPLVKWSLPAPSVCHRRDEKTLVSGHIRYRVFDLLRDLPLTWFQSRNHVKNTRHMSSKFRLFSFLSRNTSQKHDVGTCSHRPSIGTVPVLCMVLKQCIGWISSDCFNTKDLPTGLTNRTGIRTIFTVLSCFKETIPYALQWCIILYVGYVHGS